MWNENKSLIRYHLQNIHKSVASLPKIKKIVNRQCGSGCGPSNSHFNPQYSSRGSDTFGSLLQTQRSQRQRPRTTQPRRSLNTPLNAFGIDELEKTKERPQTCMDHTSANATPQRVQQPPLLQSGKYQWEQQSVVINQHVLHNKQQQLNRKTMTPASGSLEFNHHPPPLHHEPFPNFSPDRRDADSLTADLLLLTKHRSNKKLLFNKASGGFL